MLGARGWSRVTWCPPFSSGGLQVGQSSPCATPGLGGWHESTRRPGTGPSRRLAVAFFLFFFLFFFFDKVGLGDAHACVQMGVGRPDLGAAVLS